MSDHTPGPWTAVECDGNEDDLAITDSDGGHVCYSVATHADAELIAAAPELLSALRGLLDWCREHTGPTMPNSPYALLCVAHEAIAKAEGRVA